MRVMAVPAAVLVCAVLAGCGSTGYADSERAAIGHMAATIQTYNQSRVTSVSSTGWACSKASDDLAGIRGDLDSGSPPTQYAAAMDALRKAYAFAQLGFRDCKVGAAQGNYPLMAQAVDALEMANRWIAAARRADH